MSGITNMENCNAKLYIDKNKYLKNIEFMEKRQNKPLLPVLKANAYGFGLVTIFKILYERGHRHFVVARFCEALELSKANEEQDVKFIILESMLDLDLVKNNPNFIISVNSIDEFKNLIKNNIPSSRMKIKLDFGFGRNGILESEIPELKKIMIENNFKFNGIYSHLFAVDYEDGLDIIKKFVNIVEELGKENFEFIDLQNGMGVMKYESIDIVTHIRCGLANYGLYEYNYSEVDKYVEQIFSLKIKIAGIKDLTGSKYLAYQPFEKFEPCGKRIAKLKIGYGDGFLKLNENQTCLINGKEYRILHISMDNTFVEVDESVKEFDEVTFYHNIWDVSKKIGIMPYGLLIVLSNRIERVVF